MSERHIAIIGSGPTGLEAALAAHSAGLPFTIFEAAPRVADHVRQWGHVQLFTPWSMNVSPRARAALEAAGHDAPDSDECPTGDELVERVLEPIASLPEIEPNVRLGCRVLGVSRDGFLKSDEIGTGARGDVPFRLVVRDPDGVETVHTADVVLDCSGTFGHPNAMGVGGIHAPGEVSVADSIERFVPNLETHVDDWMGKRILLVGGGHSAQTAAVGLVDLIANDPETSVVWSLRSRSPEFDTDPDDPLPARSSLGVAARELLSGEGPFDVRTGTVVDWVERTDDGIRVGLRSETDTSEVIVDRILSLTGSVGDASIYRQLQVHECYATSGPMNLSAALLSSGSTDCLTETSHGPATLQNPEPDFFILGEKSYGRNTNFLMRVGWEQVADVLTLLEPSLIETGA